MRKRIKEYNVSIGKVADYYEKYKVKRAQFLNKLSKKTWLDLSDEMLSESEFYFQLKIARHKTKGTKKTAWQALVKQLDMTTEEQVAAILKNGISGTEFTESAANLLSEAGLLEKYYDLPLIEDNLTFKIRMAEMLTELNDLGFGDRISPDIFGSV